MTLDPDKQAALAIVLAGIGSQDAGERAAAGAAADTFLRERLGMTWRDVADVIEHLAAVHNWSGGWFDRAPRADTQWSRFVDGENRFGYGRWQQGQALTVREYSSTHHPLRRGGFYFAAINGNPLHEGHGKTRLFRNLDKAKEAVEKTAAEALEFDIARRST